MTIGSTLAPPTNCLAKMVTGTTGTATSADPRLITIFLKTNNLQKKANFMINNDYDKTILIPTMPSTIEMKQ